MAMVVKNNMSAVRTLNTLNGNSNALQGSLAKVSSGMKINSAQDDASGYAISERMRVQIRSLDQANQNTQNGSSLMKTAEGAVSKTVEILKSLKEKAISAATDTNTDSDRVTIQKEIDQFIDQIDDNALVTFNGKYLVDGSKTQAGKETYTAMTNQSLAKNTAGSTAMTALQNRNNQSLEIAATDFVTASFVKDGKTFTTKYQVGDTSLEDVFKNLNDTFDSTGTKPVFGAAHLEEPKEISEADAKKIVDAFSALGTAQATLLKVAGGSMADSDKIGLTGELSETTVADFKGALNKLGQDAATKAITGVNDFDTAKNTLETAIKGVYDAIATNAQSVTFTATGGSIAKDDVVNMSYTAAKVYDAEGNATANKAVIDGSVTAAAGIAQNGKTAAGGFALSTSSSTYVGTVMTSVNNIINQHIGGTTTVAIDDAAKDATTITQGAGAKGDPFTGTATSLPVADGTLTAPTAVSGTSVENYAKAYAIDKIMNTTGDLVYAGSNVGLAASGDMVSTANGESGVTVTAANKEIAGQISGLAISITDSQGNVKKSANASLDAFSTTIFAANKSDDNALKFHVGATANLSITVGLADMRSEALGLKGSDGSKVSVATQSKANAAVATFDNALQKALDIQTTIGAVEARLDYTSSNLTTSSENVQAAESTIRDADMAKEMTNYTKNNVLLQAAQSMLAQANQNSSAVLSLLQ